MELDKRRIEIPCRSAGDGMEYTTYAENIHTKDQSANKFQTSDPKYSKNFAPFSGKRKEPKFVPYEPYKAAVSPIIPSTKKCEDIEAFIVIDSQKVSSLASSVIKFDSIKKEESKSPPIVKPVFVKECDEECIKKVNQLEEKILRLANENSDLQSQFKIQTEVNADLKKMLIASLGEDMQLKVQYMTEDKARLGMNLLQFTDELVQKNEEIEKLSVQCDVWKSKFEASSVMVDELARWKLTLSQQLNHATLALESLLKEHKILSEELCTTYSILRSTQTAFNSSSQVVTKWDHGPQSLMQLSKEIQSVSTSMQERLLGRASPRTNSIFINKGAMELSPAEQSALQVLKDYDTMPYLMNGDSTGRLCHNPGKTACQILPHVCTKEPTVNCCNHCSGEIQLL